MSPAVIMVNTSWFMPTYDKQDYRTLTIKMYQEHREFAKACNEMEDMMRHVSKKKGYFKGGGSTKIIEFTWYLTDEEVEATWRYLKLLEI